MRVAADVLTGGRIVRGSVSRSAVKLERYRIIIIVGDTFSSRRHRAGEHRSPASRAAFLQRLALAQEGLTKGAPGGSRKTLITIFQARRATVSTWSSPTASAYKPAPDARHCEPAGLARGGNRHRSRWFPSPPSGARAVQAVGDAKRLANRHLRDRRQHASISMRRTTWNRHARHQVNRRRCA